MPDLDQLLAEVRALLAAQVVDCPGCLPKSPNPAIPNHKYFCSGKVPNPAFAALLRVFRVECPEAHEGHEGFADGSCSGEPCSKCHGTGYITRSWEGLPPGALRGAIEDGLIGVPINQAYRGHYREAIQHQWTNQYTAGITADKAQFNGDQAALAALREALEGR